MATRRHHAMLSYQTLLWGILGLQFGHLTISSGDSEHDGTAQTLAVVQGTGGGANIVVKWLGTHTFPYEMDIPNSDPEGIIMETISSISWQNLHEMSIDGSTYINTDSNIVYATSDNSKLYKLHVDVSDGWLDQGDIG